LTYVSIIDILTVKYYIKSMTTVILSPKYQVVIPKEVREKLKLKPGQKLQIINVGDRIEFVPIQDIKQARGFLKGIDTNIEREGDRE